MRNWLHYKSTDNSVISSVPANITSKKRLPSIDNSKPS